MNRKSLALLEQIAAAPLAPDGSLSERRWKVYAMRRLALTWDAIAAAVDVSEARVRQDYNKFMRDLVSETRDEMIADSEALMRDIIRANYVAAMAGDIDAGKMLICAKQETHKLFGLYAPTRVDHGIDGKDFANEAANLFRELGMPIPQSLLDSGDIVDAEVVTDPFDLPRFCEESANTVTPQVAWSNL